MDTRKKHSLYGAIIILSCFLLLAGACENNDRIDMEIPAKDISLNFSASIIDAIAETRSVEIINGFTGNSYSFGMSIVKDNASQSEIFEGSGNLTATMSNPPQAQGGEWSWVFKRNSDNRIVTPQGPEGKPLKVIAYYPVISGNGAFTDGIPFDFTETNNLRQTEILYNTSTGYTIAPSSADKATIPLRFQHAYSWIVINVTKYVDTGTFNLTGVAIDNLSGSWIKNKGNIDPETGMVKEGATVGAIGEARSPQALNVTTPRTYEFLVPAFMDAGVKDGDIVIALMINGNKEIFPIHTEFLNQDGNTYGFKQGYKNTYNLEFNNSSLNLRLLNWTATTINGNFGVSPSAPTNFVTINYLNYSQNRPPLWPTANNGVVFPQKYNSLSTGNHQFESYLTTVSYGGNGEYVPANPVTTPPPAGGIIINDDANVATWEGVYPKFQMTTTDVSIEQVPWEDENGRLVAKEICRKYNGGGFHDWRLPRASELRALFLYLLYNAGTGTPLWALQFRNDENQFKTYWTGTEVNENQAWSMFYYEQDVLHKGPMISPQDKKTKLAVRCIREID